MKRREALKLSARVLALSALGVCAGCKVEENNSSNIEKSGSSALKISPKQTAKYSFSTPLPLNYEWIDKAYDFNKTLKKGKITTFYNSIPFPLVEELMSYHSYNRGINKNIKTIDEFIKYVEYAHKKGFDFVYTLNSPRPVLQSDFDRTQTQLFILIDKLKEANCNKFKISNPQLLRILSERYPDIELQGSTSFEFHNISQYINLLNNFPKINYIDVAIDENRNFEFLKNLRKQFPKVKIEIIVNEPCLRGCPARISHCSTNFLSFKCAEIFKKDWLGEFCKLGLIYPWNLDYYSAIGINNFKFVPLVGERADIRGMDHLTYYIDAVENGIKKYTLADFFYKIFSRGWIPHSEELVGKFENIKLADVINLFPDIKHFIQNGSKCENNCTVSCNYCLNCADKLKKYIG